MGTRNLICVIYKGEYKVAQYGQWDGGLKPAGQGAAIIKFILHDMRRDEFIKTLDQVRFMTKEEIQAIDKDIEANATEENYFKNTYPHLSRDAGADVLKMVQAGQTKLVDGIEFAKNSLLCEYAYVIDMDKDILEIYLGFNNKPLPKDARFYNNGYKDCGYYPVKLWKAILFSELSDDTAATLHSELESLD